MTALVEVAGLTVRYHRRRPAAVRDVSFALEAGEALGIVGESGSGKSTTARALLGLLRPDTGTILWDGQPVTRADRARGRLPVAAVFQDPHGSLDPTSTIRDIVTEPRWARRRIGAADRTALAVELLERVALPGSVVDRRPAELSGGQQQRAAIARALCARPRLLVLDEPVSALDVSTQAGVLRLLERLRVDSGMSMLLISHDLGVVASVCDRVLVMRDGHIVDQGPAVELLERPTHPYTAELVDAMPVLSAGRRPDAPIVPDPPTVPDTHQEDMT